MPRPDVLDADLAVLDRPRREIGHLVDLAFRALPRGDIGQLVVVGFFMDSDAIGPVQPQYIVSGICPSLVR